MQIPIACSLEAEVAGSQLAEWATLARSPGVAVERPSPTELAIRLPRGAPADAVVGLAQREKACCPFFDFTLGIEAEALTLRVTAPAEASALLDALVGNAT